VIIWQNKKVNTTHHAELPQPPPGIYTSSEPGQTGPPQQNWIANSGL
jgi:hypothetical protein